MNKKWKQYNSVFKVKVSLEAIGNESTVAEIPKKYGVYPTMVSGWKRALLNGVADIFDKGQMAKNQYEVPSNKFK